MTSGAIGGGGGSSTLVDDPGEVEEPVLSPFVPIERAGRLVWPFAVRVRMFPPAALLRLRSEWADRARACRRAGDLPGYNESVRRLNLIIDEINRRQPGAA